MIWRLYGDTRNGERNALVGLTPLRIRTVVTRRHSVQRIGLHQSMTWRSWPDIFQARSDCDSSPLSERPRTTVPVGALHLGFQCLKHSAAKAFHQPSSTCNTGSTLSAVGFFSCWPHGLDFIRDPTISANCFRYLLKTYLFDTSASNALGVLDDNYAI